MTHANTILSRWLRSRQLLADSGYGVANSRTYPFFAVEDLGENIFRLSVVMPPCDDDELSIQLDGKDLVITAAVKNSPQAVTCEHRFRLISACTLAGANWERGNLIIELIAIGQPLLSQPHQLIQKYHGSGNWLLQQAQRAA